MFVALNPLEVRQGRTARAQPEQDLQALKLWEVYRTSVRFPEGRDRKAFAHQSVDRLVGLHCLRFRD